jgi:hypothetical protein
MHVMKNLIFVIALLLGAVTVSYAQPAAKPKAQPAPLSAAAEAAARTATQDLTTKYALNGDQAKQMYTIQARKQRNLASIESLKTSDPKLYDAKLQSIQKGTLASIRRILNNKEQVTRYEETQREVRNQKAIKRKEMTAAKASKADIEAALNAIYAE